MTRSGKTLYNLFTPALVLDARAMRSNQARLLERYMPAITRGTRSIRFRPLAVHGSIPLALQQTPDKDSLAIMTANLDQAEIFATSGQFHSVLHSVPPTKHQLERVLHMHKTASQNRGRKLHIVVDSLFALEQLDAFCNTVTPELVSEQNPLSVLLKLDGVNMPDLGGVDPTDHRAMLMVKAIIHSEHLAFDGVFSTSGHAMGRYFPTGDHRISLTSLDIAKVEAERVSTFVREMSSQFDLQKERKSQEELLVSMGGTAAIMSLAQDPKLSEWWPSEINEVHAGSYMFMDMRHVKHGTCTREDCAAFVVTTVMGHSSADNAIIVDAGALAMGKYFVRMKWDEPRSQEKIITFGCVLEDMHMHVVELFPEFGIISSAREIDLGKYPIGSQMRIIPCHSGLTMANFDRFHVVEDIHAGDAEEVEIIDEYPVKSE